MLELIELPMCGLLHCLLRDCCCIKRDLLSGCLRRFVGGRAKLRRRKLRSRQQGFAQEEKALGSVDWGDTIDEDQHVAWLDDSAVWIVCGLARRSHPSNVIDGNKGSLNLFNASENVLQIKVRPLPAVIHGFLFD